MELLAQNPASALALVSLLALCLVALIARASKVEHQTRIMKNKLYSPFDSK